MNTQYSSGNKIPHQNKNQIQLNRSQNHLGGFQNEAIKQTFLKWSSYADGSQNVIIHSQSDILLLKNLKNILLSLQTQFFEGGAKVIFTGQKKDDFNKRLILLQNEIQGLLKRRIQYSVRDQFGGARYLDYSNILNQKQTQVIELEKKINNLEERLRRQSARELQLENHIAQLYAELKKKETIILSKNDVILAEVATSNAIRQAINRIKRNIQTNKSRIGDLEKVILEGVNIPEIGSFDIKADVLTKEGASSRTKGFQNLPQNQKPKTQLIQLFRQFERFNNQDGITDADVERILQGFLVGFNGTRIKQTVDQSIARRKLEDDYIRLKDQFGVAVGILQGSIDRIKRQNAGFRFDIDPRIFEILRDQKISVYKTAEDIVHLERFSERTVQVPVQDARTKHLIHLLAVQMKKFCGKYPKLLQQMDVRLTEFFQQQVIDIIQVDQVDRLVEIVKYVPQVVKVENVYAYSSEKSRRIQFHLRVLVKALLEELEKLKRRTGVVLQIDQGVIGMINQEIMGVVDVDDILKVFRVVPKIVEVEKIVEKVVDRIVEVPQIVPVEKIIQKIVEVQKIREVQRIVNVPLEIPNIVQNIVEKIVPVQKIVQRVIQVPQIYERVVQVIKQIPKLQIVERIQQRQVEVQKVVQVEKIVNHIETKVQVVEVIVEKIIPTQKIIQIVKQVPVIVEKIVERVVQIPKVIQVEKLVQIVVPVIQYRNAKQIQNHIQIRHNVIDRIIQKPVPIIQTVQRFVEIPQIVQKIVTVQRTIQEIKQVEKIVEKVVIQQKILQIVKQVKVPFQVIKQVIKQVQKIVQIPVVHQKIVTVQQIIQRPIIQRIQNTVIKEVYLRDPIIIRQPRTIQVQKIINHYIDIPKPIKYIEQKIVQVVKYVDRIKEVKVPVEKIIEKMVEVPKVVQVQKIVQRVVVVPRVVQKIVEVPQVVQRVVPKIIIEQKIKQVEKIIQVPMIQQKIVQVEIQKNVYIEVEKIIQRIVDKLVQVPKYQEKIITKQILVEKAIEIIKQVPRNIQIQKIVHITIQNPKIVQVEKQIIVPVQIPVPMQKIVEKIVPITQIVEKIVQVPQILEKIVSVKDQVVQIVEIPRIQQKIIDNIQYKQIVKQIPYITEKIKQVQKVVQKIVPVQTIVQQIVTAKQIVEKIVEKTITVPKIYDVERIQQKIIEIPKIVEVQKIIPQIVNVNRYIQNIVEKIVEVPIIIQQIKEIVKQNQKIVLVKNEYERIKQVEAIVQKSVIVQKFKQVVRNINHIQKVLQIVDRYEQTPVQILVQQEKFIQVPYILQKIVEKIVIMPQIVQVLKYVHQITQKEDLGVAVGVDVATHEQRLKFLSKDIKVNFDILLTELRKMLKLNPSLKLQIELIQKFLIQLQQFILYPKIFQIPKQKIIQKIVEKDKLVGIPTQDQKSIKMQLSLTLLVEKLIIELKRVKKENPNINLQLEDDIKLIFFTEIEQGSNLVSPDFNNKLKFFADSIYRKFQSLGSWSIDHQMMLNSFLQQRFIMANLVKNANLQIEKARNISSKRDETLERFKSEIGILEGFINKIRTAIMSFGLKTEQLSIFNNILGDFDTYISTRIMEEPVRFLGDIEITDARIQSMMRQKEAQISRLREKIFLIQKSRVSKDSVQSASKIIQVLRSQNLKLKNNLSQVYVQLESVKLIQDYKKQLQHIQERNLQLQQIVSNLKADLANYKRQNQVGIRIYESNIKDSGITGLDRTSRVSSYQASSPDSGIKLIQSAYRAGDSNIKIGSTSSKPRQPTYGTKTDQKDQNRSTIASQDKGIYPIDSRYSANSSQGSSGLMNEGSSSIQSGQASRYSGYNNQSGQNITGYGGQQFTTTQRYSGATYADQTGMGTSLSRRGTSGYQGSTNILNSSISGSGSVNGNEGTRYGTTPPTFNSSGYRFNDQGQGK